MLITQEVVAGGFEENSTVFEEFDVVKKCRFKALQRKPALDRRMVEMRLLQYLEEVEDLITHCLVLNDVVAEQGGAKILRRETYNQLIMREFLDEQVDGFLPTAVVVEAVPNKTTVSSYVIPALACATSSHVIPTLACGGMGSMAAFRSYSPCNAKAKIISS